MKTNVQVLNSNKLSAWRSLQRDVVHHTRHRNHSVC